VAFGERKVEPVAKEMTTIPSRLVLANGIEGAFKYFK
jgi:hypothetical protein